MFKEIAERKERNHTPVRALWRTSRVEPSCQDLRGAGQGDRQFHVDLDLPDDLGSDLLHCDLAYQEP